MSNYCNQCGTALPQDCSYCPACGASVGTLPVSTENNGQKSYAAGTAAPRAGEHHTVKKNNNGVNILLILILAVGFVLISIISAILIGVAASDKGDGDTVNGHFPFDFDPVELFTTGTFEEQTHGTEEDIELTEPIETVSESESEAITESVTEPITEPVTEPVTEPITEPVTEPIPTPTPTPPLSLSDIQNKLYSKYGKASGEEYVSCYGVDIQNTPESAFGVISVTLVDLNSDGTKEILTLRYKADPGSGYSNGDFIVAEIYRVSGSSLDLVMAQDIYQVEYCSGVNIYLYYSDTYGKYCLMADVGSAGAYTGVNARSATVFTLTDKSIDKHAFWEFVPGITNYVDFDEALKEADAPYAKYCTCIDLRSGAGYFAPVCEIKHTVYADTPDGIGIAQLRNHKLTVCSPTDEF